MENFRGSFAEIDLDAVEANYRFLADRFPAGTFICPMIKADAYGHGAAAVARALKSAGAKRFGVCLLEEGLSLRAAGIDDEVLVFLGVDARSAKEILRARLTPVVSSFGELDALAAAANGAVVDVHLKFDTGMHRLGFMPSEGAKVLERAKGGFRVKGVCTHLWQGDDAAGDDGATAAQLRAFDEVCARFAPMEPAFHALNSAGALRKIEGAASAANPLNARNWGLRPGLMIFGGNPLSTPAPGLKPAMALKSRVVNERFIKAGDGVSYGHTWRAKRDSWIAVVGVGYADGVHRILSNRGSAMYDGKIVPFVGNVCMDYLMIDVTDAVPPGSSPKRNEEVLLFGGVGPEHDLSVNSVAQKAQTIAWEVMTSVSARVPRVYRGRSAP